MKEYAFNVRGAIYLAEYSHKHGNDYSIHTTQDGAQDWFKEIAADWKENHLHIDEEDPYYDYSLDEMVESLGEISGGTEFFDIHELELQK